jgi:hypothetical protein
MTATEEAAKRLHFPDGGRARLFLYPKALPYRVPDYLWYLVHVEKAVVKGGAPGVRLPPPGRPVRPGALPGVEPGLLRARGPWGPPGLGVR